MSKKDKEKSIQELYRELQSEIGKAAKHRKRGSEMSLKWASKAERTAIEISHCLREKCKSVDDIDGWPTSLSIGSWPIIVVDPYKTTIEMDAHSAREHAVALLFLADELERIQEGGSND